MPATVVVVLFPVGDDDAGLREGPKVVQVQAFVADPAVERFDVAVAPRLPGRDEVQSDALRGPVGHRGAGEFGAVVGAQDRRVAAGCGDAVEFCDEVSR